MIRPKHFGFNQETADSNSFQANKDGFQIAEKAVDEFDIMVEKLKSNGVSLKVFNDIDKVLPDAVFPNNWFSHFPHDYLVIYSMMAKNRQKEIRPDIIDTLKRDLKVKNLINLSDEHAKGRYLEGTGSIVFDHDNRVAYCCESPRSNLKLLKELCDKIGYEVVSFESLDLNGKQIYHTNVMMSVCSQIAIVCLESLPNILERKMLEKKLLNSGKEILELSYQQMNNFAANIIELQDKEGQSVLVISDQAVQCLSNEQLNILKGHFNLISIQIPTIEKIGGGSVRCMIAGCYC